MNLSDASDIRSLMRPDRAHRSVYLDPKIFDLEMRNIFGRAWVYVGHESLVPRPGDYITARMGSQPIVLSRHTDGRIYVFYNTCSHRGSAVCSEEKGHTKLFRCPYHGWTFATNGDLDAVILNANDSPTLLRNDLETSRKSVQIALRGAGANREGVGARVTLHTDQGRQIAEVHRGSGYQSHGGNRLHFGLGKSEKVRQIEVRWPTGGVKTYEGPPDAPCLLVDENRGVLSATLQ